MINQTTGTEGLLHNTESSEMEGRKEGSIEDERLSTPEAPTVKRETSGRGTAREPFTWPVAHISPSLFSALFLTTT